MIGKQRVSVHHLKLTVWGLVLLLQLAGWGQESLEGWLFPVPREGGTTAFVNAAGEVVIEPRWYGSSVFFPEWPLLSVREAKSPFNRCYIDRQGRPQTEIIYSWAWQFQDGFAVVRRRGEVNKRLWPAGAAEPLAFGAWSLSRPRGGLILFGAFPNITGPRNEHGLPTEKFFDYLRFGFMSVDGATRIEAQFLRAGDFAEGVAPVEMADGWHFIDAHGKRQWPDTWEEAYSFSSGRARVRKNGKYGYLDRAGKLVIRTVYEDAGEFCGNYAPVCLREGGEWALIDKQGIVRFRDLGWREPKYSGGDRWLVTTKEGLGLLISFPRAEVLLEVPEMARIGFIPRSTEPFDGVWRIYEKDRPVEFRDLHGRLLLRDSQNWPGEQ